jgi:long-chain acyl-CoA synthetase
LLKITDRKKMLFKTSGGKFIAPQVIENKLKESRFIEQVMVVGDGQPFPAALIVPRFMQLLAELENRGIFLQSHQAIAEHPTSKEIMEKELDRLNEGFDHYMQVKKFELLNQEWTYQSGELTPKLEVRRKIILKENQHLIEKIYQPIHTEPAAAYSGSVKKT